MCAFVDHGEHGTGETLVVDLRPGKASPWDSADHIAALDAALAQLPEAERGQVLVRTDTGGCSKAFLHHITDLGLEYSIGFPRHETVKAAIEAIPAQAWRPPSTATATPATAPRSPSSPPGCPTPFRATRPGPQDWPAGMRVIARRERPHPGAQLRLTDHDGWRITCFATNTHGPGWTLAALEVRHRQRARAEDRIRGLKDTGLRNLPFHGYAAEPDLARDRRPRRRPAGLDPDPRLRPAPSPPAGGNPNGSGCGSSPSPAASSAPAAEDVSGSPATGPGTTSSTPAGPRSTPPDTAHHDPTTRTRRTGGMSPMSALTCAVSGGVHRKAAEDAQPGFGCASSANAAGCPAGRRAASADIGDMP